MKSKNILLAGLACCFALSLSACDISSIGGSTTSTTVAAISESIPLRSKQVETEAENVFLTAQKLYLDAVSAGLSGAPKQAAKTTLQGLYKKLLVLRASETSLSEGDFVATAQNFIALAKSFKP